VSPDPATITGIGAVPFKEFSSNQNKLHFKEKIRITKATLDLIQKKNKKKPPANRTLTGGFYSEDITKC